MGEKEAYQEMLDIANEIGQTLGGKPEYAGIAACSYILCILLVDLVEDNPQIKFAILAEK